MSVVSIMSTVPIDLSWCIAFLWHFFDVIDDDSCEWVHTIIDPFFCYCVEFIWRFFETIFYLPRPLSKSIFCENRGDMTSGDYATISIHKYECWFSSIFFCVKRSLRVCRCLLTLNVGDQLQHLRGLSSVVSVLYLWHHLTMESCVSEIFPLHQLSSRIIVFSRISDLL